MSADTQLDLLAAVGYHPRHDADRARIIAAIRDDATAHGQTVDPNRVRASLTNEYGLTVHPRMLSAQYGVLKARHMIEPGEWTVNTDTRGGNAGKPLRTYRWVGA